MSKKQTRSKHKASPVSQMDASGSKIGFLSSPILHLAILLFAGILVYCNSFNCSFHFDDDPNILMNKVIRQVSIKDIWNYSNNRFLPFLSFAINYHFGEYDVWGYHLVNLIIHLLTTGTVYWLSLLVFTTPALRNHPLAIHRRYIAFGTALLFVSHPLATQSVTYIVQRMAAMVALFYLLSVALYIKGRLSNTATNKIIFFSASALAGLAAIHTKENAYTLPIALFLTEITLLQSNAIRFRINDYRVWISAGLIVVSVIIGIGRFSTSVFNSIPPSLGTSYSISSKDYLLTQFSVIVKYIQLLLLPMNQNLDYDYALSGGFFEIRTLFCFIFLMGMLVLAIWQYNRNRIYSFGIFWFFITLAIESSIVPIADLIFEHRTYLPSFGFFLIVVSLLFQYIGKIRPLNALVVCLIMSGILGVAAYQRNKVWADNFTLKQDIVQQSPGKARPKVNLGMEYMELKAYDTAIQYFKDAAMINNKYFDALNNTATCFLIKEKWDSASFYFTKAIEADSTHEKAFLGRGMSFSKMKKYENAIADYNKAISMRPTYYEAYSNRGMAYLNNSEYEKAIANYDQAISLNAAVPRDYFYRGLCKGNLKQYEASVADFSKSIAINPNDAEVVFNRGITYANLKKFELALKDMETTIALAPQNQTAQQYKLSMEEEIKKEKK